MMNKRDKQIILIAVLCQFIISFISNMITILLPEISQEFIVFYRNFVPFGKIILGLLILVY